MKLLTREILAVLYDADGTILDNLPVLTEGVCRSILTFFGRNVSADAVLLHAKRSLPDYLYSLLPETCEDPARLLQAVRTDFETYYAERSGAIGSFEGIPAMLDALAGNYRLGFVSSRQTSVRADVARLALADYFDVIVDRDETERHKPDPEPLLLACKRLNVLPEHAIYVGDAPADIHAARAAGMLSIGVTYGGNNREELLAARPDYLSDSPEAIATFLVPDGTLNQSKIKEN